MSSTFDVANIVAVTAVAVGLGYATIWALKVRRVLAIRAYQNQALGVALIAAMLALLTVANTVGAYLIYNNPLESGGNGGFGLFFVLLVTIFYWIDSSVIAARRSDPLSRDTLHWSRVRILLWIGTLPAAILVTAVDVYSLIALGGNVTGGPPAWSVTILVPGIFIPPISGAVLLPIISRRSGDQTLRRHLKWFGLFAVVFLVFNLFLSNQPDPVLGLFSGYVGDAGCAFCLYRSVLSLALGS